MLYYALKNVQMSFGSFVVLYNPNSNRFEVELQCFS